MKKLKFDPDIIATGLASKLLQSQEINIKIDEFRVKITLDISKVNQQIPVTIQVDNPTKGFTLK